MLNLLNSRVSFPGNFRRSGLPSFHCSSRIGATEVNALSAAESTKENALPPAPPNTSEPTSPLPASSEPVVVDTAVVTAAEKSKKVKSKSKKLVQNLDINKEQPSNISLDASANAGKKSKRGSPAMRSEDVVGHCGHFPVDDLVEFIDTGRKLNRERSRVEDEELDEHQSAVGRKLRGQKILSSSSAKYCTVENDSGFGDIECCDRVGDAGISDGLLSPTLSSGNENAEVEAEILNSLCSDNAMGVMAECYVTTNQVEPSQGTASSKSFDWTKEAACYSELMFDSYDHEKIVEGEFVVVQQKKRRPKATQSVVVVNNKPRNAVGQFTQPRNVFSRSATYAARYHRTRPGSSTDNSTRSPSPSVGSHEYICEIRSVHGSDGSGETDSLTVVSQFSHRPGERLQPNLDLKSSVSPSSNGLPKLPASPPIETGSSPVIKGQLGASSAASLKVSPSLGEARSCNQNCVKTSDVGTMTLPDVVPNIERPATCAASILRPSTVVFLDNANRQFSNRHSLGAADVVFGFDPEETSDSCRSTSTEISRTQSPCSSCDEKSLPVFGVATSQLFDLSAAQQFLHKAYQNVLQMKKTHPHSVCLYQPEKDNGVEV